ncbi:MAG: FkbM family methyltransferase [Candidatus Heimdallarchaeota archaeon]|nr:FkbM family methyltransferase [Candidatus Heimdallarchaeota archaeon]
MQLMNWLKSTAVAARKMVFDNHAQKSYSQEGEDRVLYRIFEGIKSGFFVDVGAHHPRRFSNTYLFYKQGWRGINIDAMPGSMAGFKKDRPLDINLELPVSNSGKELTYYSFNEPALNGFSKELTEFRENLGAGYYVEEKTLLKTHKLSEILNNYIPQSTEIDFMTIDVEGLDFEVIQSNDWKKFRPKIILVEILNFSVDDIFDNDVYLYLKDRGYEFYAKTVNTVFFCRSDFNLD